MPNWRHNTARSSVICEWDAFRSVDHMIDSEADDIREVLELVRALTGLKAVTKENKEAVRERIMARLETLSRAVAFEKKLAQIVLGHAAGLLELNVENFVHVERLMDVAARHLRLRMDESRRIIRDRKSTRLNSSH